MENEEQHTLPMNSIYIVSLVEVSIWSSPQGLVLAHVG